MKKNLNREELEQIRSDMSVIAMQQNWIDIMTKDKKAVIEHLKNLLFGDETGYNLCV